MPDVPDSLVFACFVSSQEADAPDIEADPKGTLRIKVLRLA